MPLISLAYPPVHTANPVSCGAETVMRTSYKQGFAFKPSRDAPGNGVDQAKLENGKGAISWLQ